MAIGITRLIDAISSHAASTGFFTSVQNHEPKNAPPGEGLHCAVFLNAFSPSPRASGLDSTTARVELTVRLYNPFLSQPEDLIDPRLADAADKLFELYTGDFELGGSARNVDVLGAHGAALSCRAGYQKVDTATFRVIDITVPIIVNDSWEQGA